MPKLRLNSKQFFSMVVLSVSLLGLMLFSAASLTQTNTESSAQGCEKNPSLKLEYTEGEKYSVIYYLRLTNNCKSEKDFKVNVIDTPTEKYGEWWWKFGSQDFFLPREKENVDDSVRVKLTTVRPVGEDSYPAKMPKGAYRYFTVKASLEGNPSVYDIINLIYYVE